MHANRFFGDFKNPYALHTAGRAGEIFVNRFAVDADGLKQLCAAIRHVSGHAHLGHDFGQAFADRFDVVVNGFVSGQVTRQLRVHAGQGFHRQIRMNRFSTVTCQHRKVMHFAGAAGFHHQACTGAQTFFHQMLVNGRQGQQRGNRHLGGSQGFVADDENVVATFDLIDRLRTQGSELGFHAFVAPTQGVCDIERGAFEFAVGHALDVTQLGHILEVQNWLADFQAHRRIHLVDIEQVGFGSDKRHQRHDDGFADWVDRRVGHLREQLFEVVVERFVFVGQHGQRTVVAHGAQGFFAVGGHGRHEEFEIFLCVTKSLLAIQQ